MAAQLSANELSRIFWSANGAQRIAAARAFENYAVLGFVTQAFKTNPDIVPDQLIASVGAARKAFKVGRPIPPSTANSVFDRYDVINTMFSFLASTSNGENLAPLREHLLEWVNTTSPILRVEERVIPQTQAIASTIAFDEFADRQLQEFHAICGNGTPTAAGAARVSDALFKDLFDASVQDSAAAIVARNPVLNVNSAITSLVSSFSADGTFSPNEFRLDVTFQDALGPVNDLIKASRAAFSSLDAKQTSLADYAFRSEKAVRDAASDAAAILSQTGLSTLGGAASAVQVLASILAPIDKGFSQVVRIVGGAAVQVATAIQGFSSAASAIGSIGSIVGSVALCGTVVGAVAGVVGLFAGLFGGGGPDPVQQEILNGIKAIQEQVRGLQRQLGEFEAEVNNRFDRIDSALNTIYSTLVDRFNRIDAKLAKLEGDVNEVQSRLLNLQTQLSHFEANLFSLISETFRFTLKRTLDDCIDFNHRHPNRAMTADEFDGFQLDLHLWATDASLGVNCAGPTDRIMDDSALESELSQLPPMTNVNFIFDSLRQRCGLRAVPATQRLPNPFDWSVSAEALFQLAINQPQFALDQTRLTEVIAVGTLFQTGQQSLNKIALATPNRAMFKSLFDFYAAKSKQLELAIEGLEQLARHGLSAAIDFRNDAAAETDFIPPTVGPTPGMPVQLAWPNELMRAIPAPIRVAMAIGMDVAMAFDRCVFSDLHETPNSPGLVNEFGKLFLSGDFTVTSKNPPIGPLRPHAFSFQSDQDFAFAVGVTPIGGKFGALHTEDYLRANWTNNENIAGKLALAFHLDPRFDQKPGDPVFDNKRNPAGMAEVNASAMKTLVDELNRRLGEFRSRFCTSASDALNHTTVVASIENAFREWSGARALVVSTIEMALPESVENNDLLRSLLYGNAGLPTAKQLQTGYAQLAKSSLDQPATPVSDQAIRDSLTRSMDDLRATVELICQGIEAGNTREVLRSVDGTLSRLRTLIKT